MILSIWIFKDILEEFHPAARCRKTRSDITGLRVYASGAKEEPYALYVGRSDEFFEDGKRNIVCKNRNDYLILDTDDISSVINKIQDAYSRLGRWNDKCIKTIYENCSLNTLLDCAAEEIKGPLMIVDAAQVMVAHSSDLTGVISLEEWENIATKSSLSEDKLKEFNRLYKDSLHKDGLHSIPKGIFPTKSYCRHLYYDGDRVGTVILKTTDRDYTTGETHLFDIFVTQYAQRWVDLNVHHGKPFSLASNFKGVLDGNEWSFEPFARQLTLYGWAQNCTKQLLLASPSSSKSLPDVRMCSNLSNRSLGIYTIIHEKRLVLLINLDQLEQKAFMIAFAQLIKNNAFVGAVSFPFKDLKNVRTSYMQTLNILNSNPHTAGSLYFCRDDSMRIISAILEDNSGSVYVHPLVALLGDYDKKHSSELKETLFCFLRNESRPAQTAQELYIHRNTLSQRLAKIKQIYPMDLTNPQIRFYLLFSFFYDSFVHKKN